MSVAADWRWIVDPPADGAWNMAVDEALLESYAGACPPSAPTLRLYSWSPPALSVGRGQPADPQHHATVLRELGIQLVRRPTGGSAVLHEHERTYAVVGRLRAEPFAGAVGDTYRRVAEALCAGLRQLGIEASHEPGPRRATGGRPAAACFGATAAHEITVGGLKLVGSAQLRRRGAFLQHGSILQRADAGRLAQAAALAAPPSTFTDLQREVGPVDLPSVDRALARGFTERFAARLCPGGLSDAERLRATELRSRKYLSAAWTFQGSA